MMIKRVLGLCLVLAAGHANAADDSPALAGRLIDLLRYDEQFAGYFRQCMQTQAVNSPELLVAKSPDYFGGLRPGNADWNRVLVAYKRFYQQVCSRPTKEEFVEVLQKSYVDALTPSQLRSAIQFYSSPAGQALAKAHRQGAKDTAEALQRIAAPHVARAMTEYQSELTRLIRAQ